MYVLRVKDKDGVQTFTFNLEEAVYKAADWVMRTTAAGFIAEVESSDSTHGKILKKWDHSGKYGHSSLHYTVQSGAYKDRITATLGTETNCLNMAEECNKNCNGWWCRSAHVEHIVGPLWQVVYTDPYTD